MSLIRNAALAACLGASVLTAAPAIVSVSPDTVQRGSSLSVSITGSGTQFQIVQQASPTVNVQDVYLSNGSTTVHGANFSSSSAVNLNAWFNLPSDMALGSCSLTVQQTNPPATIVMPAAMTIIGQPAPHLTSVNPSQGYAGTTLTVTITGAGTDFASSNQASPTSGGVPAQASPTTGSSGNVDSVCLDWRATHVRASTIQASSPTTCYAWFDLPTNCPRQKFTVSVYMTGSVQALTLPNAFAVLAAPPPRIVSISPSQGMQGQTISVDVWGQYASFLTASRISTIDSVKLRQSRLFIPLISVTPLSADELTAVAAIPSGASLGKYDLCVWQRGRRAPMVLTGAFTVTAPPRPRLIGVQPNHAYRGQALTVTITGAETFFVSQASPTQASPTTGSNVALVELVSNSAGSIAATGFAAGNDQTLSATFTIAANAVSGVYDLHVATINPAADLRLPSAFTISDTAVFIGAVSPALPGALTTSDLLNQRLPPTDAANRALTWSIVQGAPGLTLAQNRLRWAPVVRDTGSYNIVLSATASAGTVYVVSWSVNISQSGSTAVIREAAGLSKRDFAYTLTSRNLSFDMGSAARGEVSVKVLDARGAVRYAWSGSVDSRASLSLPSGRLPAGAYFMQVTAPNKVLRSKVVLR